jgi:hypothetical protein
VTTTNHTPIVVGASNSPTTINTPLGELDAAIGNLSQLTGLSATSIVAALLAEKGLRTTGDANLDARVTSEVASLEDRIDSIITLNPDPSEVVDARSAGNVPSAASTLTDRMQKIEGNKFSAWAYHATGTIGSDSADDTAAIEDAIAAMPSAGGILVIEGVGAWKIAGPITISKPMTIVGAGPGGTELAADTAGTTGAIFSLSGTSKVTISGIKFNGGYSTTTTGNIIAITDCSDVRIQNCEFVSAPVHAIVMTRISRAWIENNSFDTIYKTGVYFEAPGSGNENAYAWVRNNYFRDIALATDLMSESGISAVHAHGTQVDNTTHHLWVENNVVEHVNYDSISIGLDYVHRCVVRNNRIIGRGTGAGEGIAFNGNGNLVEGNIINGKGGAGVYLFADAFYSPCEHNSIAGNVIWDCNQGITVNFTDYQTTSNPSVIDHLLVAHNICYNTAAAPLQTLGFQVVTNVGVTPQWDNVLIVWNDFRGSGTSTAPINISPASLQQAGAVLLGNTQDAADNGLEISGANLYRGPARVWGVGGTVGATDPINGVIYRNRHSAAGAKIRFVGNFTATEPPANGAGQQAGGMVVTSESSTRASTWLLSYTAGALVETGGAHPNGRFGSASSAYNGACLRIGARHLWVDANGELRVLNGEPAADTDGTRVNCTPSSAWNGQHWLMGSHHFWVSTTDGKLYTKASAPTGDQDGTIVGSQ